MHRRGGYIIGEDERNVAKLIAPPEEGGFDLNAVWADDFHHNIEVTLIDASMYAAEFRRDLEETISVLQNGWLHPPPWPAGGPRHNTPCAHLPPERFVYCISNHDQIGNRACGERLNHFVSPEVYRAASALLCLVPYTPLIFMGQEWGASTPFLYFTDHHEELGRLVVEGRRRDLQRFAIFDQQLAAGDFPSPQAPETFQHSKLRWEESEAARTRRLSFCGGSTARPSGYRREHPARSSAPATALHTRVAGLSCGVLAIRRARTAARTGCCSAILRGGHRGQSA